MNFELRRHLRLIVAAVAGPVAIAGAVFAAASDARAAFILELADSATTVTVVDGGASDADADAGKIKYSGSIGIFGINLTTGRSKPVLGSAGEPEMQLNSVDVSSSKGGGTLTIKLTDTDFTPSGATHWVTSIFGATSGALSFEAYVGLDNQEFSTDQVLASFDPLTGLFAESASSQVDIDTPPFSVTLVALITHGTGLRATGFSANVKDPAPPGSMRVSEPMTLVLFGTGLLGLGLLARQRRGGPGKGRTRP